MQMLFAISLFSMALAICGSPLLQEADRRGVVDTSRIAVGGHSYGAFMAANLLVRMPAACILLSSQKADECRLARCQQHFSVAIT